MNAVTCLLMDGRVRVCLHGAKFEHSEGLTGFADALLAKEHRAF